MDALDALLDIVELAGGKIAGRTTIQKIGYFSTILGIVKTPYHAHYYGPYSADIAETLEDLTAIGFLEKTVETRYNRNIPVSPDWKRYIYQITDDGKTYLQSIRASPGFAEEERKLNDLVKTSKEYAHLDPYILSWAAKVHFILKESGKAMDIEEVRRTASNFNWDLSEGQIEKGISLLRQLHLIKG